MKKFMNAKQGLWSILAIAALTIGLASCEEMKDGSSGPDRQDFEAALLELDVDMAEHEDYIEFANYEKDYTLRDKPVEMRHDGKKPRKAKHGNILRELDLSDEQKELLKQYREEMRLCIETEILPLIQFRKEAVLQARETRKAIIDLVKSDQLSREEATTQIVELNQNLRQELRDNMPEEDPRCRCLSELHIKIESMLNDEQLAMWTAFLENREHKPCDRKETDNEEDDDEDEDENE